MFGDLDACYQLGEALSTGELHGTTVKKNDVAAAWWYARAARKGHSDAQYELGFMYLLGEGVAHNAIEGLRWMSAAAEQGHAEPMRVLADSYGSGKFGVEPDRALAAQWTARLSAHLERRPEDRRQYGRQRY